MAIPVPFRLTLCGLPVAFSAILKVPDFMPAVLGLKLTVSVQLPLQRLPTIQKSLRRMHDSSDGCRAAPIPSWPEHTTPRLGQGGPRPLYALAVRKLIRIRVLATNHLQQTLYCPGKSKGRQFVATHPPTRERTPALAISNHIEKNSEVLREIFPVVFSADARRILCGGTELPKPGTGRKHSWPAECNRLSQQFRRRLHPDRQGRQDLRLDRRHRQVERPCRP